MLVDDADLDGFLKDAGEKIQKAKPPRSAQQCKLKTTTVDWRPLLDIQ